MDVAPIRIALLLLASLCPYNAVMIWMEPIRFDRACLSTTAFVFLFAPLAAVFSAPIDDADLHDVEFADVQTGWTVGDRGAIWHTGDGGATWEPQPCPSSQRLSAVSFVDAQRGWVIDSGVRPYVMDGTSRVLSTEDAGQTWSVMKRSELPYARDIALVDQRSGFVLGSPQSLFPGGLFQTTDAGRSWHPLPSQPRDEWIAVDVGAHGRLLLVERHAATAEWNPAKPDTGIGTMCVLASLHDGCYLEPGRACVVGDAGTVLILQDGRWLDASAALPQALGQVNLRTVTAVGESIWAAGSPGSVVVRSRDGGKHWQPIATGQTLPIHKLCFVDELHGWAVGALGLVMATTDGGQTWQLQRGQDRRLGALVIADRAGSLPLVLLAHLSAENHLRSRAVVLGSGTDDPSWALGPSERLRAAALAVGANGCQLWDDFAMGPEVVAANQQVIAADWVQSQQRDRDRAAGGDLALRTRLARAIRQWRPSLVAVAGHDQHAAASQFLLQETLASVAQAAKVDAASSAVGLTDWNVSRVLTVGPVAPANDASVGKGSILTIRPSRLAMDHGKSIGELASAARTLISAQAKEATALVCRPASGTSLPRNWIVAAGGPDSAAARRPTGTMTGPAGSVDSLMRATQRQENVRSLLSRATTSDAAGRTLQLMDDLPASTAARLMLKLADQYGRSGNHPGQIKTWESIRQRFPATPAAEHSLWRQFVSVTSEERQVRFRRNAAQPSTAELLAAEQPTSNHFAGSGAVTGPSSVVPATNLATKATAASASELAAQAAAGLRSAPEWQLALAAVERDQRGAAAGVGWLKRQKRSARTSAWQLAAAAELWLADPTRRAPRPTWSCPAGPRTYLDGQLDDPLWQAARSEKLGPLLPLSHPLATEVFVARDQKFLYLAVRCQKIGGVKYPTGSQTRPRDTRPGRLDRVDFFFDVNRDYHSGWQLGFDCRGFAIDSESGDLSWNPNWFVAASQTDSHWIVEAAVPLAELTLHSAELDAWVFGVRRVVPGWGWQAWPQEAGAQPAWHEMGYLTFQTGTDRF